MPIHFTCQHCGATTDADDHLAGQNGPCSHCGKLVTIPAFDTLTGVDRLSNRSGALQPAMVIGGIFAFFIGLGIMIAVVLPAIMVPSAAHRRAQTFNNLKQIGLAFHTYHQQYGSFPPAFIADENGRPMHSWRVMILPYMDQQALHDQYRFDEPWDGPNNRRLHQLRPSMYKDPSFPDETNTYTNYAVITGGETMFPGATPIKTRNVRDGLSTVLAAVSIGESDIVWCEPRDLDFNTMSFKINDPDRPGIKNESLGDVPVVFGDGSVRSLEMNLSEAELKSLILRKDGK